MDDGPVQDISGRGGGGARGASGRPAPRRVLVFGASGSGTSTLGRHLACRFASQHFDVDDIYWRPTDPPFRSKRPEPERVALMRTLFLPRRDWVLSGALETWGTAAVVPRLTHAVFLTLDAGARRARLEARERRRHGAAMGLGGCDAAEVRAFLGWADGYEAGLRPGRSRARHEAWIATLPCPVVRLEASARPEALVEAVCMALEDVSVRS